MFKGVPGVLCFFALFFKGGWGRIKRPNARLSLSAYHALSRAALPRLVFFRDRGVFRACASG